MINHKEAYKLNIVAILMLLMICVFGYRVELPSDVTIVLNGTGVYYEEYIGKVYLCRENFNQEIDNLGDSL